MALLDGGHEDLEVVGELRRQDALWRIVGGRQHPELHMRMDIYAALVQDNDAHAIAALRKALASEN